MIDVGLKLKEVIQNVIFSKNDGESLGCSEMMATSKTGEHIQKAGASKGQGFGKRRSGLDIASGSL